jgi:hypothetical protein
MKPTLRELLVGDLGPAIRHLDRIKRGALPPSPAVLDEIEAAIARCVERILASVPDDVAAPVEPAQICEACGAQVRTREQWITEKCPAFGRGDSGHTISHPRRLLR